MWKLTAYCLLGSCSLLLLLFTSIQMSAVFEKFSCVPRSTTRKTITAVGESSQQVSKISKDQWLNTCQKFFPKGVHPGYGSHAVVLLAALYVSNGSVLEFGCGLFSTPVIHNFLLETQRQILSTDTELDWLKAMAKKYESPTHKFQYVNISKDDATDWLTVAENCNNYEYDVILIDQHDNPNHQRTAAAIRVKNCAHLVIVHDTEHKKSYRFGPIFENYRFSYETQQFGAGVIIMSNSNREWINQVETLVNKYLEFVNQL